MKLFGNIPQQPAPPPAYQQPVNPSLMAYGSDSLEAETVETTGVISEASPRSAESYTRTRERTARERQVRLRWQFGSLAIALLLAGICALIARHHQLQQLSNKSDGLVSKNFSTLSIPLEDVSKAGALSIQGAHTLSINGQLNVNNSLVLSPAAEPSSAVAGQLYYDQSTNQLKYYDGKQFVQLLGGDLGSLAVKSLGGSSGDIALGNGLRLANGTLSVSGITSSAGGVLTLQGQAGNVTLTAGNGIAISGTTISSSGVLSLGGQTGNLSVGNGLSVSGGALSNSGILSAVSGSPNVTVTNDGFGNITISSVAGGSGTVQSPGGTAGRIAKFTGVQTVADSLLSESGTTVTVNGDLSVTGQLNLGTALSVANGGTGAGTAAGALSNLGAAASGANSDITSLSGLTTALSVAQGGIGVGTLATNGVIVGNGSSALTSVVAGASGLCLMSTAGAPSFQACPSGVGSFDGLTGALSLANSTGSGTTVTIDDASTTVKGIAEFNATNFLTAGGIVNTIQDIAVSATPTFAGLTLSSPLGVGSGGTGASTPSGARSSLGAAASGANSDITSITGLTTALSVVQGGTGATSLTANGVLLGNGASAITSLTGSNNQCLVIVAGAPTFTTCPGSGGVSSVDSLTGAISISNTTGSGATITIDDAKADGSTKGIATFNSANFSDNGSGVINTIQGIATTSSPTFAGLTLTSALSVGNGGTGATTLATNGVLVGQGAGAVAAVTAGSSGQCLVSTAGAPAFQVCPGSGGVTSVNGLAGVISIANASAGGSTITINDATTGAKGIASFNSTNFTVTSGAVNTIQDITTSSAPTFGQLSLTSSQASNPMFVLNNTNVSATGNLIDLQLNGTSEFSVTPNGNTTAAGTINGQTISSTASFTGSVAVGTTLSVNTITPSSSLTIGAAGQSFLLQGNASSTLTATNAGKTTTLAFQNPTANVTYTFKTAAAGSYNVCTTVGNCSGVGGGVTSPGGTVNQLAKFTAGTTIGDSIISDDGSTVTIAGALSVNTLTPSGALTVGDTGQNLTLQGATVSVSATSGGTTNTLTFATPSSSNKTITLPNATGTVAVSASGPLSLDAAGNLTCATCLTSGGGGGMAGVSSVDSLTGAITIANSSGSGATITIDNAKADGSTKGIATFNSANFSDNGSGVINTIQDITTSAAPTFGQLTVTSSQATNPMLVVNNTNAGGSGNLIDLKLNGTSKFSVAPSGNTTIAGTVTSGTINGQTISNAASFTGSVSTSGAVTVGTTLNVNTITPSSALSIGATGQSFTLQGNASSSLTATNGGNTTTVNFQSPTASVSYRFATAAAGSYDVCTTNGNCLGSGGGANAALSNLSSVAINTSLLPGSAGLIDLGSGSLPFRDLYLAGSSGTPGSNNFKITGTATGARTITLPDASGTVAVSATGYLSLSAAGNLTFVGPLAVADGGTGATTATNARSNLSAAKSGANSDITSLSGLTTALSVSQGGTGLSSLTANQLLFASSSSAISQFSNGSSGDCLVSNGAGSAPSFQACTGSGGVASVNSLTGAITIANASTGGSTITIDNAKADGSTKGIATFNSTNFSDNGSGVINTIQGIATSSSPTFSTLTLTNSASLTLGTASSNTGSIKLYNSGSANAGTLQVASLGQATTYTIPDPGAGTATICLSTGNCAGSGSGVTTSGGTTGTLPKFTGSQSLGDSIISESGSTITINGNANLTTGNKYKINGSQISSADLSNDSNLAKLNSGNSFTGGTNTFINSSNSTSAFVIQDAAGRNLFNADTTNGKFQFGNITSTAGQGVAGTVVLADGTNDNFGLTLTSNTLTASRSIAFPDEAGTVCLQNSANCGFLTGAAANGSYVQLAPGSAQSDGSANASIFINDTGGGNLAQLQNGGADKFVVNGSGNVTTGGTYNGQTISSSANFTGSVTVATAVNVNTLTPSSSLTVGATGQSFTLQGNASSTITATGSGYTTTVGFTGTPTGAVTYNFDRAAAAGTYTICTTIGNCAGSGGGLTGSGTSGKLAKFTGSGTLGDSIVSESGSTLSVSGSVDLASGNQYKVNGSQISSADLSNDSNLAKLNATQTFTGATNTFKNTSNSTSALSIQNAAGRSLLNVDTTNAKFTFGNITSTAGQGVAGTIVLADGTNDNFGATINTTTLTANRTITIPDATGTVCLDSGNCLGGGSGGANTALSNLVSTSINQSLIANANNTLDLGSSGTTWRSGYFGTAVYGPAFDTAGASALSVGTTNANAITIGRSAITTTFAGTGSFTGNVGINNVSSGNPLAVNGVTTSNTNTTAAQLLVGTNGTSNNGVVVQMVASQAANTYAFLSTASNGNISAAITSSGSILANGGTVSTVTQTVASTNSVDLTVRSGNATGATSNSGNVYVDAGTATGTTGTVNIGTTNANAVTLGRSAVATTIQGNASTSIVSTNSGNTTTIGFSGSPTGNLVYNFDTAAAAGTYNICTTVGNCAGSGGGITGSGTTGKIAKFTASGTIGDSLLSESGSTVTIGGNLTVSGSNTFTSGTGAVALNGDTTIAAGKNLTLASGAGTITQNYSAGTGTADTRNVTNSASSGTTTVNGLSVALTGTNNGSGANTNNALNFANVTAKTNNTFNGLYFGTGYDNLLNYNGTSLISGTGKVQNAALDSTLTYSNITGVGALTAGSIASGFGTINTTNNITTSAALQGGTAVITAANGLTLGTASTNTGGIVFKNSTNANSATLTTAAQTVGSATITLPNVAGVSDTVCLLTLANCLGGGAGGANTALSNLVATSINQSLIANANNSLDIGSSGTAWANGYFGTSVQTPRLDTSSGALLIGDTNATNITVGSTTSTSTLTLGQSTDSNTINVGDANTATTKTQTINIGAGTPAGTGKAVITIGNTSNASALNLQAGTGNLNLLTNNASASIIAKSQTNSTTAFQVQNSGSTAVLSVNTSNNSTTTADLNVGAASSTRIFSDNFETGSTGASTLDGLWNAGTTGGTTNIVESTGPAGGVRDGKYDYKVTTNGSGGFVRTGFPSVSSTYSFRSYVYIETAGTNMELVRIFPSATIANRLTLYRDSATGDLWVRDIYNGVDYKTTTVLTTGAWHKLEMRVTLSTVGTGSIALYIDNSLLSYSTASPTNINTGTTADTVILGEFNANSGNTYYFDDMVIDSTNANVGDAASLNVADTLHVAGTSTFGSSLFVQNAAGTNVFTVDTANAKIGTVDTNRTSTNSQAVLLQSGNALGATSNSGNVTIDSGSATTTAGTINLGTANSPTINIGSVGSTAKNTTIHIGDSTATVSTITIGSTNSTSTTTIQGGSGGITLAGATTISGSNTFTSGTGAVALNGDTTVAAGKNLTLASGAGTITQTFVNTTGTADTRNVTNSASSGTTTVNGLSVALAGTNNGSGANTNNALNFTNVTAKTNNTFNGLYFGTGYDSLVNYNGTQIISGSGKIQNAALDSTLTYSNITGVGALTAGSIASGFGTINTTNNITTTATVQGGSAVVTGANALTLGTASTNTGGIVFKNSTNANSATLTTAAQTVGSATITLPNVAGVNDTVCLLTLANCLGGAGGGANTALSNLVSTSINQSLIANADNSLDLGSSGTTWRSGYFGTSVQTPSVDTAASGTLTVAGTNATTINIANNAVAHTVNIATGAAVQTVAIGSTNSTSSLALNAGSGGITLGSGTTISGSNTFTSGTGAVALNGDTTIAAGKNLTLASGAGTITQNYSAGTGTADTRNVTNSASSGTTTVNGLSVALTGTNNGSGANTNNALNFANVTAKTNNTFNGLYFGTGYDNLLNYNGTSLISGTGKVQNAALDSTLTYSNITGVGALTAGSIASGFGTINTTNNITTSAALQGGTAVITAANGLTLGTASTNTGGIVFKNSTNANTATLTTAAQTVGSATITIPNVAGVNDTVCLVTLANCTGSGGANTALSNLVSTSINQSLIANANNSLDLGSSGTAWRNGYFGTSVQAPRLDTISGALLIGDTNATNITVGSTSSTSTLTLGQSTASNTINIGNATPSSATQTINIGAGGSGVGSIDAVTIGSTSSSSSLTLQAGTGNFAVSGATATTYTIGTGTGTGTITLGQSTDTNIISIGNGNVANTKTQTIRIGSTGSPVGSGKIAVSIGNTANASSLLLAAGTGDFTVTGATTTNYIIGLGTSTGTHTFGQSTDSNTINIGNANTITAKTQTINIGAGTPAGTGKAVVTIGNTLNASALNLQAGTGNINLLTNSSSASTIVKTSTNSDTAFQVTDSSNNALLNFKTTTATLELGVSGGTGSTLTIQGDTNNNTKILNKGTLSVSAVFSGSVYAAQNNVTLQPATGATISNAYGLANVNKIDNSSVNIPNAYGIYNRNDIGASYSGTITNYYGAYIDNPTLSGSNNIATNVGLYVAAISGNDGTVSNPTINRGIQVFVPSSGSDSNTANYGLNIQGNGGTGATNWAIYSTSTANSSIKGALALGGNVTPTGDLSFANNAAGGRTINVLTASSNNGDALTIQAGNGNGTNKNGGNLILQGGDRTGTGTAGGVVVKPQTNSTAAFQVQNASSTALLTADTTNNSITIGTSAATTTLLVLGIDSDATISQGSASNAATEVDGAMFYSSTSHTFICGVSGTWRSCLGGLVYSNTSVPGGNTVANTTTETAFNTTYSIPANDCQPGRVYRVTARGVYGTTNASPSLELKIKVAGGTTGTVTLATDQGVNRGGGSALTNDAWEVTGTITCDTTGTSGTLEAQAFEEDNSQCPCGMQNAATKTVDTTAAQTLQMSAKWGTANASNTITLRQFIIEAIGP